MLDYVMIEEGIVASLTGIFFLLLVYAGLKQWRWKIATRGEGQAMPGVELTGADWRRILGFGVVLPLALYLLYIAIPALSGRDHSILKSGAQFLIGAGIVVLWLLIVPATLTAGAVRRRMVAAGLLTIVRPWRARFGRLGAALLSLAWAGVGIGVLLIPTGCILLIAVMPPPQHAVVQVILWVGLVVAMLGVPLLPAWWERKHPEKAPVYLALTRALIPVYAACTLLLGLLLPVLVACEHHYVQTDHVMGVMQQGELIAPTYVEGEVTLMLRQYVNEGAARLHLPNR
jgi:hypothetical protein